MTHTYSATHMSALTDCPRNTFMPVYTYNMPVRDSYIISDSYVCYDGLPSKYFHTYIHDTYIHEICQFVTHIQSVTYMSATTDCPRYMLMRIYKYVSSWCICSSWHVYLLRQIALEMILGLLECHTSIRDSYIVHYSYVCYKRLPSKHIHVYLHVTYEFLTNIQFVTHIDCRLCFRCFRMFSSHVDV